jgi:hypothetical protein
MHSNQINNPNPTGYTKLFKGAYKRRAVPTEDKGGLTYIEGRSGEYDARERDLISDPYADGWKWAEDKKPLHKFSPPKFAKADRKAEIIKLFELGFNDCKEMEGMKK